MKSLLIKSRYLFRVSKSFLKLAVDLYIKKSCQQSAASLTYMTLFAIVPLMTVTYSMFSIIPAFQDFGDEFQHMIFAKVLPSNEQVIIEHIQDFSQQARKLTVFGIVFLIASAYFMLKNIERHFNAIWSVPRERRGISNFLLYWAILSLGPLLLGLALAMNTYLITLKLFIGSYNSFGIVEMLLQWLPWLLTATAFTLLFVAVPNCKVRITHAAVGGVLTMIGFELCKYFFGMLVTNSSLSFIYGAFAAVPLLLLWINLSWMVVLGGAVFVRTISLYQVYLKDRHYPDFFGCLLVLWQFHVASFEGQSVTNTHMLQLGLSTGQWQRLREILLSNNVISFNQQNEFVLSRDLTRLTLKDLKGFLGTYTRLPEDQTQLQKLPWLENAQQHLGSLDNMVNERLNISVQDFFESKAVALPSDTEQPA